MTKAEQNLKASMIESLKEMREACAACFRVIAKRSETIDEAEAEFSRIGLKEGFGGRCQDVIAEAERSDA
jgi:hypothetical protein